MTALLAQATSLVVFILLVILPLPLSSAHGRVVAGTGCVASEKEALLSFKQSFLDPAGRLSSWQGKNCCQWEGVRCSKQTGHVVKLDLRGRQDYFDAIRLRGEMSCSIAALRHLRYLDLSFNFFNYTRIPLFLGTLSNLRYLNLSNALFVGIVPSHFGNLSHLQHLDLSYVSDDMEASDFSWVSRLSLLKTLNISGLDLSSMKSDWVHKVNMLPNLEILSLSNCYLDSTVSSLPHSNLTRLEVLDLSNNDFDSSLLQDNWFWGVTTIKKLLLSDCGWSGPIPDVLANMSSLEVLYLDDNLLTGVMPTKLEKLCNLQKLDISSNDLDGDMMESLPKCSWSKLRELDLQRVNLIGQLPVWIGNLTSLSYFDISQNMLVGSIPSGIGNMRSLQYFDLSHNMLVGDVPDGIGALSNLTYLNFGTNNFSGILSKHHFASLVNLKYIRLSENSVKLCLHEDWVPPFRLTEGHFGSSDIGPQFPTWLRWQSVLRHLNISNTGIHDVLPHWFWAVLSNASNLDLSGNQLTGALPKKLELPLIGDMDLSRNSLSGQLPANLTAPYLTKLLLHDNHFTGAIPTYVCSYGFSEINLSNNQLTGDFSQCSGSVHFMVDLKHNLFSGEFPGFLRNASLLTFLDLSYNMFSGSVPGWIAEEMCNLEVLILRSNNFQGHLPKKLTKLVGLHYLDVAHNNLSGSIPLTLARLRAMTHSNSTSQANYTSDSITTFIKDRELNYTHELIEQIALIDLSNNSLTGRIPNELSFLKGLRSLNLSRNQLSGTIPRNIGALRGLESLDLSYNYFIGEIPSSLSDLTFLSSLNLSYNDLSGRIPSGQQLQTLNDLYMYVGNPRLCGPPLLNNCSTNKTNQSVNQVHDVSCSYLSLSTGFMVGLWTVFCAMLFKKTWRIAYFQIFDVFYDKVYVQVAINKAAFMRKFQDEE